MRSVVLTGFRLHTPHIAGLLNKYVAGIRATFYADTRVGRLSAFMHAAYADASITVGGPRPNPLLQEVCVARKRPAIVLWVGSDVVSIAQAPRQLEPLRLERLTHWTNAPQLARELSALGIESRYVVTACAPVPADPAPLPQTFTVLTYLPEPRRSFYGQDLVWQAASEMPDVPFLVVGAGRGEADAPPNVRYLGEVSDMSHRIDAATVLLRLPEHDGLSQGVIEGLARGRHVIWTYKMPGVIQVQRTREAVINALHGLHDAHKNRALGLNDAGMHYVSTVHSVKDVAKGVARALDDEMAACRRGSSETSPRRCVAISGNNVFAARVAANCEALSATLTGIVLASANKSDLAVSTLRLLKSNAWYSIGEPRAPLVFDVAAKVTGKPRILHWLGGDIDRAIDDKQLLRRLRGGRFKHLAQNDSVARRLSAAGLSSTVVPLAACRFAGPLRAFPQTFTLLLYLPEISPQFYGRHQYERLMRDFELQPVRYIIVGGGQIDVPTGVSAERYSWCHDLDAVYDRSTVLVRFTESDAVCTMVIEALLRGRYAFCSSAIPFAIPLRDYRDLERGVRGLLEQHLIGRLLPQADASDALRRIYSEHCLDMLARACTK